MSNEAEQREFDLMEVATFVDHDGVRDGPGSVGDVDGSVGCDEDAGRLLAASAVAGVFVGVELEMVLRVR